MRDFDYSHATDFLAKLFGETTEHAVEIRALPNERGAGRHHPLFTRDPDLVEVHCQKWDQIDRAMYFGAATRVTGSPTGTRADLAELPALFADIDTDKHGLDKEQVARTMLASPLPPSAVIDSGGGLHLYWSLREAIDVRRESPGWQDREEAVVAVLKQLAGVCGGDTAVCELTRILRLPGTHNTKTGELRPARLLEGSWVRYEFDEIVDTLDWLRPLVTLPAAPERASEVGPTDPFLGYAARAGIKMPLDAEQRLAAMSYMTDGDAGIHQTQLHVSASLATQGVDDDEIVELLIEATKRACFPHGANWNWKREDRNIRRMIATAREKFGKTDAVRPRAIVEPQAVSEVEVVQAAVAGGTGAAAVVNLAEQRRARNERQAAADESDDKRPLIPRVGDAVIEWWRDTRGQIAIVDGQPYTYGKGLWTAWSKADLHALKVAIQGVLAASKIDPKTQLLNAVSRYVIEHPDLMREGVEWDDSGFVICLDGAIDPLTREIVPHSPDHWAAAGAEVNIADMGQGCPQWLGFLDACFSDLGGPERAAVIAVLSEWFGAAMVRKKPRELRKALWLYGESRTGKTRIAEVLRLLIGEPTSSLKLRALEKNFGGSALIGRRAWIADDAIGSADEVDDALFKVIVTGEAFSTDVKNAAHETLRLTLPVLFTSNPLPRVKDQSDAVFNRAMLIHMRVVRSEEETAGLVPIDELVRASELAGVFSWALDGWARLFRRGRFIQPLSMREAAEEFKAANNVVGSWVRESVIAASGYMVDRRDTYASFRGWYITEYGETAKPPSPKFVMTTLRQVITLQPDKKLKGWPCVNGVKLTDTGLAYRKELGLMTGTTAGSGCSIDDINKHTITSDVDAAAPPPSKEAVPVEPDKPAENAESAKMPRKPPRF